MSYVVCQEFLHNLAAGLAIAVDHTTEANNRLIIYKGTMPTDANTYTEAGHSANELCRFTHWELVASGSSVYISLAPTPLAVTATGTGTATWAAAWNTSVGEDTVIIGDVGDASGGTFVSINTTTIAVSDSITFINMQFNLGAL